MNRESDNRPVVFVMGATATGKTALAAALCDGMSAELINVDAAHKFIAAWTSEPANHRANFYAIIRII